MDLLHLILAILPFTLFCLLLVFHTSASLLLISLWTLVVTFTIARLFWPLTLPAAGFSLVRGTLISLDIFLIIFGAILFLEILKKLRITESLAYHLDRFSPDRRIQVIFLAWFLENFLEGIAGFGTPSTVVAPMLVALGIPPLKAVVIALLGNSISVPFGAVGTPLRVGFAGLGLPLTAIGSLAALYNFAGLIVPVFMLWVMLPADSRRKKLFFDALPFALFSGIAFVVPAYFVSRLGIEFPSIFGAVLGLLFLILASWYRVFLPALVYRPSRLDYRPQHVVTLRRTLLPYLLFIIFLVAAKFIFGNFTLSVPAFSYTLSIFNPGIIFIFTSVLVASLSALSRRDFRSLSHYALKKTVEPFLVVAAMSVMVQLMNSSGSGPVLSITQTISLIFKTHLLPAIAPFIGALGSFLTGSATVSNLMFASSLHSSAQLVGLSPVKILALALAGAGTGNMIALADVLAAKTVVDPNLSLRHLIAKILPYCTVCLVLLALLGMLV